MATKAEFRSLTISAGDGAAKMSQADGRYRRVYTVIVRSDGTGRTIRFTFHDSITNHQAGKIGLSPDELLWAFQCFVSDAEAGSQSFTEFCDDSRTARRSWEACRSAAARFRTLWAGDVEPGDVWDDLAELVDA